ncbi:GTPase Era [Bacteroidota bacterium]
MPHKSGFVNIIGNPNVGKSTLMNVLVGEKLSIITSKMQTTRHRIMGIVNGDDFQIVYSDTPGIIKPHYKLQKFMLNFVNSALQDADILLYLTDVVETWDKNKIYLKKLNDINIPIILLINKIDLVDPKAIKQLIQDWKLRLPKAKIIPVSALKKLNIDTLLNDIINLLPECPPYFPKDQLTDKPEKFFVSEFIREQILINYRKEIPYSVEIEVEEFKEDEKIIRIRSVIHVVRETQKGIIIGHKGNTLKKVGTEARKGIETFFNKKVFLELFVKVNKEWRNNDRQLKSFGYHKIKM